MTDQGADQSSTNSTSTSNTYSFPSTESTHNNITSTCVSTLSLENIQGQTQDDQSLMNDIFQYLSQVPLHHPTATRSLPDYTHLDPPIIQNNELFGLGTTIPSTFDAQGYKNEEQDSKNVNVSKVHDPKGKLPLQTEGLDIHHPHGQYLHESLRGLEIKDIDISKGQSQGKQKQHLIRKHPQDFIRKRSQKRTSELRRRHRINDKIKIIQSLIPNSKKGDHASILHQAIDYIKYLKHQLNMLSSVSGQSQLQAQSSSASAQIIPGMYNIMHWPSQMVTHPSNPYRLRTPVGLATPQLPFQHYMCLSQQNPVVFALPQQQLPVPVPQRIPSRSHEQLPSTKPSVTSS